MTCHIQEHNHPTHWLCRRCSRLNSITNFSHCHCTHTHPPCNPPTCHLPNSRCLLLDPRLASLVTTLRHDASLSPASRSYTYDSLTCHRTWPLLHILLGNRNKFCCPNHTVLKELHTPGWTVAPVGEHAAGICGEEGDGNLGRWQKWIYSMAKTEGEGIETLQEFEEQLADFMDLQGMRSRTEGWDMEWICWGRDYEREGEEQTVEEDDDDDGHGPEVLDEQEEDNLSQDASRTAMGPDAYGRNDVVAPVLLMPSSSPLSSVPSINSLDVEDDETVDLATFPRCLRCVKRRNGCDRRRPICGQCEAAGVGEDGCVSEDISKAKMGVFRKKTGKMVRRREIVAMPIPVAAATPALDLKTALGGVEMEQTGVAFEVEA